MPRQPLLLCTLFAWFTLSALLVQPAHAQQVAPTEPLTPAEQLKKFHLPPGFEIQLVASEPQIHKPINMAFDSQGRLLVTDTIEYPFPAKNDDEARDSVKVLVDRDGDGAADDVTTLVDHLNIPLGVLPIPSGVLVYGIPAIYRCLDVDGDGRAEKREMLYGKFGSEDTHGMVNSFTRGLDGWVYATHGFRNTSTIAGSDGQAIAMNSGNTFRFKLDGSHVEYFCHGQVNPFGLAFDPLGNLYSADCHTLPVYMLLRGAWYPSFGKAHDGLDFGPTMIKHSHGSTGIGGVAWYDADQFPAEYRDTVFIGNPVTGRVNHDRLDPHGSTLLAVEQPDFVKCDDPWFRPVNLQLGPDGALYIADFYNRIIGHYEVPLTHPGRDRERGRIWRVVYTGKGAKPPVSRSASISKASRDELLGLLGNENMTVRTLATHEMVDRCGKSAIEPLTALLASRKSEAQQRVHAMWALERLSNVPAMLLTQLTEDSDRAVRTHAMKLLAERAEWPDPSIADLVRKKLRDPDAFVQRAAADALGRHPHVDNVRPLIELWNSASPDDTHLIHVVLMALRDHLRLPEMYDSVQSIDAKSKDRDRLVSASLGVSDARSAAFLWQHLQDRNSVSAVHLQYVARFIDDRMLKIVLDAALKFQSRSLNDQVTAVRSIARGLQERGVDSPAEFKTWTARLTGELLASSSEPEVKSGIEIARDAKAQAAFDAVARVAGEGSSFAALRQPAMDACVAIDGKRSVDVLAKLLSNPAEPLGLRQPAATALARMNDQSARDILLAQLKVAPEKLALTIAGGLAESSAGAEMLLTAVSEGKAAAALLQETAVDNRLRARGLPDIGERLAKLTKGLPPRDQKFRELVERRRDAFAKAKADMTVGAQIFKKSCANCHRIGEDGAKIGPNLDGVGVRGVERILEDLLDPNRNVDQAFRTTQIETSDGRIVAGLMLQEEGQLVVLADAQGKEIRVAKDEIEQKVVSPLSLMPANVSDQIPEDQLAHLLAYLLAQRQTPILPQKQ